MSEFDGVRNNAADAFGDMDAGFAKTEKGKPLKGKPAAVPDALEEENIRAQRVRELADATPGETHSEKGASIVDGVGSRVQGMGALDRFAGLSARVGETREAPRYDYEKIAGAIPDTFTGESKSKNISMARNGSQENLNIALQKAVFEAAGITNRRPTRDLFVQLDNSSIEGGVFKASVTLTPEDKLDAVKRILGS